MGGVASTPSAGITGRENQTWIKPGRTSTGALGTFPHNHSAPPDYE